MSLRTTFFALGAVLVGMSTAYAQENSPVRWYMMGGFNTPVGGTADVLSTGWNFGGGLTWRQPGRPFGVRLEFDYSDNGASGKFINSHSSNVLRIDGGWADVWSITVDPEFQHLFTDTMYGYVVGGIGAYYVSAALTQYGYGYICDPWWGYCYIGTGQAIVASNSSTNFGWNAGAGVSFRLQGGTSLFIEARYNYIDTSPQKFEYIPVVIGLKF